ncbi:acyltransferase family protein [Planctomycetota bacterium]
MNRSTISENGTPQRLMSLDVYRGGVMLLMLAEVMHLSGVARALPESGFWRFLSFHQSHVPWVGCSLHDMIQPSFSFLVGVVLPFSLARRAAEDQPRLGRTLHAFWRSFLLILLGIFLRSLGRDQTYFTFEDTLTQIGLGYGFLYLIAQGGRRAFWISLVSLLVGYWLLFALYPLPTESFDWSQTGVTAEWSHHLQGFMAHWNKNTHPAWAFDRWFLNLFPRSKPFIYHGGGYSTLSFIPTLATMLLGLLTGRILRRGSEPWPRVKRLVLWGLGCLVGGIALGVLGICPVVKRIWTPAWVLYSGGWCLLITAGLYAIIDVLDCRRWAFPLQVVGMNSITAYCSEWLFVGFIAAALQRHLGSDIFGIAGEAYRSLFEGGAVLLVIWLILFWMYRCRIFLRI